jgi:hypothetical protein
VADTAYRDPAGTLVPETQLVGSGPATVAAGGRAVTGTWSKQAIDQPLALHMPDAAALLLAPGNTWVELVPMTGAVGIS